MVSIIKPLEISLYPAWLSSLSKLQTLSNLHPEPRTVFRSRRWQSPRLEIFGRPAFQDFRGYRRKCVHSLSWTSISN